MNIFRHQSKPTDLEIIAAIQADDQSMIKRFYFECQRYFIDKHEAVFEFSSTTRQPLDLFQETFMKLWTEIQSRRIFISDGMAFRLSRDGKPRPMKASLLTYMMAIARYKNLELLREEDIFTPAVDTELAENDNNEPAMTLDGIALMEVNAMSRRCREILTMFYVDGKSLDEILALRPENSSKNGLKSSKAKCMAALKERIARQFEKLNER